MSSINQFTESAVEEMALVWLELLGYAVLYSPTIVAGVLGTGRNDLNYRDVVLECRTLAALRDMLLPKLISGGLRVKGAARIVEAAV